MPSDVLPLFALSAVAIFLEAAPFLLLGALISGVFEVFLSAEQVERHAPRSLVGGIAFGLGLGLLVPTCECGVVPIVRRLISKGLPPQAAMTYMLAAPVVNPVVVAATFTAFRGDLVLTSARVAVVSLAAVLVGLASARNARGAPSELLRPGAENAACGCGHDHGHDHSHDHGHSEPAACGLAAFDPAESLTLGQARLQAAAARAPSFAGKLWSLIGHMTGEFLDAGKFLAAGCLAAAAFKTFLPPTVLQVFESSLLYSVTGMMGLSVLLTICSEADAFVAASFVSFPDAAKLAFVSLGPMLDVKLIVMYAAVFAPPVVRRLLVLPALVVFVCCMALGHLWAAGGLK